MCSRCQGEIDNRIEYTVKHKTTLLTLLFNPCGEMGRVGRKKMKLKVKQERGLESEEV